MRQVGPVPPCHWAATARVVTRSPLAGAALGGLCRVRRHLRLEPAGPRPAPAEDPPAGLLQDPLHDPGEEAGTAAPGLLVRAGPGRTWVCGCPRAPHTSEWAACAVPVPPQQIWVGGTGLSQGRSKGKIYVIDAERKTVEKELVAHTDTVNTLCSAEDRYVLSGSGRDEGKIAIWKVE